MTDTKNNNPTEVKDISYNPTAIEQKWQAKWEADKLYRAVIDERKPKHYAVTMLPYPSGDLHIGHWYAMTPSDARARYMRMKGYNVLFPMGFDAFGLPAENAAIKEGVHPMKRTFDSSCYTRWDWRIARCLLWIGARRTIQPWRVNKSLARSVFANVVAHRSLRRTWSNGSSKRRNMLTSC